MKIISKFKDIYDNVSSFGIDKTLVFNRVCEEKTYNRSDFNSDELKLIKTALKNRLFTFLRKENNCNYEYSVYSDIIFINNKPIHFFYVRKKENVFSLNSVNKIVFTSNDFSAIVKKFEITEKEIHYLNRIRFKDDNAFYNIKSKKFNNSMALSLGEFNNSQLWSKIGHLVDAPIFKITDVSRDYLQIQKNTELSDYRFVSVLDVWTIFQEIYVWLINRSNIEKEMINVTDSSKIKKHGFDKMSFRKRKESN